MIHTKGDVFQRALTADVEAVLQGTMLAPWCYEDWNWTTRVRDSQRKVYRSHGIEVDPLRLFSGVPKPFVHRAATQAVDRDAIRGMLLSSVVIVLMEPSRGDPSAGVALEHSVLKDLLDRGRSFERGRPVLVRCFLRDSDSGTFLRLPVTAELCLNGQEPARSALDCVLSICRAWLIQILGFHADELGRELLSVAAETDAKIESMFEAWSAEAVASSADLAKADRLRENSSAKEPTGDAVKSWREMEDERIEREFGRLQRVLSDDTARYALRDVEEVLQRCVKWPTTEDYRIFAGTVTSLRARVNSSS